MKYEKTLTVKISIEQFDKLCNYATRMRMDVSNAVRNLIDELEQKKETIIKEIETYKYHIANLEKTLESIKKKEEEDMKTFGEKYDEYMKKEAEERFNKTVGFEVQRVWQYVNEKVPDNKNRKDEDVEKERKELLKIIKERVNELDENLKAPVIKKILEAMNTIRSTKNVKLFDEVLRRNTVSSYESIPNGITK